VLAIRPGRYSVAVGGQSGEDESQAAVVASFVVSGPPRAVFALGA
jgi:hypothetical protein